jgi:hypothetical protein
MENNIIEAAAIFGAWLCVAASLMSRTTTGAGYALSLVVAIAVTAWLI